MKHQCPFPLCGRLFPGPSHLRRHVMCLQLLPKRGDENHPPGDPLFSQFATQPQLRRNPKSGKKNVNQKRPTIPRTKKESAKHKSKTQISTISPKPETLKSTMKKLEDDLRVVSVELETINQQKELLEAKYAQLSKQLETLKTQSNRLSMNSDDIFNELETCMEEDCFEVSLSNTSNIAGTQESFLGEALRGHYDTLSRVSTLLESARRRASAVVLDAG